MYYLWGKDYKTITAKYYMADCVSWEPRPTLLELRTNWTQRMNSEQNSFVCNRFTIHLSHLTVLSCILSL